MTQTGEVTTGRCTFTHAHPLSFSLVHMARHAAFSEKLHVVFSSLPPFYRDL